MSLEQSEPTEAGGAAKQKDAAYNYAQDRFAVGIGLLALLVHVFYAYR